MRRAGIFMIVLGLAVPQVIDWYETAHALDIPRDIGVLPWLIVGCAGAVLVTISFRRPRT